MTRFHRIRCVGQRASDNDNRITVTWTGPDDILREYTVNQRSLNRIDDDQEAKAALDQFTSHNFGYTLDDIWLHKNRDGTWAIATGAVPDVWPEDEEALE